MLRRLALMAVAGLAVAAPCAHAATYRLGADLDAHPANDSSQYTCAQPPPYYYAPTGSPSCMVSFLGLGPGAPTLTTPATGTVTSVRVKVGATTGPMRVNVIRFLFQRTANGGGNSAGPFLQAYGPKFTPAANSVSEVATSLPMQAGPPPAPGDLKSVQVIDALALEVLSGTVPIPIYTQDSVLAYPVYPGPSSYGAEAPSFNALPTYTDSGFGVLMNADLLTGPAAGPPPLGITGRGPAPAARPLLAPRSGAVAVSRGTATVKVRCAGADCAGALTLLRRPDASRGGKLLAYGRAAFTIKAGAASAIRVRLNAAGLAALEHHLRVTVAARVVFAKGGGKSTTLAVTLVR